MNIYLNCIYNLIYVSLPYLLVFHDDRVMRYTRADDVTGGAGEAYNQSGDAWGFDFIVFLIYFVNQI